MRTVFKLPHERVEIAKPSENHVVAQFGISSRTLRLPLRTFRLKAVVLGEKKTNFG